MGDIQNLIRSHSATPVKLHIECPFYESQSSSPHHDYSNHANILELERILIYYNLKPTEIWPQDAVQPDRSRNTKNCYTVTDLQAGWAPKCYDMVKIRGKTPFSNNSKLREPHVQIVSRKPDQ